MNDADLCAGALRGQEVASLAYAAVKGSQCENSNNNNAWQQFWNSVVQFFRFEMSRSIRLRLDTSALDLLH